MHGYEACSSRRGPSRFLRVDIDENVLGLDVAMHDSAAVRVVQSLL